MEIILSVVYRTSSLTLSVLTVAMHMYMYVHQ